MLTLHYSTTIHATANTVWQVLWNDETYRQWTAVFMEGSYAESSWNEGDKIIFWGPGKNGMFGIIQTKVPNEKMLFRHLGEIKNGEEIPQQWENATEGYELVETANSTQLDVTLTMDDANAGFADYFEKTFPAALALVKELSESQSAA